MNIYFPKSIAIIVKSIVLVEPIGFIYFDMVDAPLNTVPRTPNQISQDRQSDYFGPTCCL